MYRMLFLPILFSQAIELGAQSIHLEEATQASAFPDARHGCIAIGDVDLDGDLDVFLAGKHGDTLHASLYRNDGNGQFTLESNTPFLALQGGESEFADVDQDGDPDLLITGYNNQPRYFANLYLNNGSGEFTLAAHTPFEPSSSGDIAFKDIDQDGDTDLMMAGYDAEGNGFAKLYANDGNGIFTESATSFFHAAKAGAIAFLDYDTDGDPDVLVAGEDNADSIRTTLYANDGSGTFTEVPGANLPGKKEGAIGVSDTDRDGDPDIILSGTSGSPFDNIDFYVNQGDGTFILNLDNALPPATSLGSVEFADFDLDGDEDLVLTGFLTGSGSQFIAQVYENTGNNQFTLADTLVGAYLTDVAIGDLDGDTDLDVIIVGITNETRPFLTRTYINALNTVGLADDVETKEWAFFPNPADNVLHITSGQDIIRRVELFSADGQRIEDQEVNSGAFTLHLRLLPHGIYIIRALLDDGRLISGKFVKE